MYANWNKWPPVAVSAACYLGHVPADPAANQVKLQSFIADMPTMKPRIAGRSND